MSLALFVSMCEFRLVRFDHLIIQCTYSLIIARTNCFMKIFEIFEWNSQTRASVYIFNFAVASALRPEINQFDRLWQRFPQIKTFLYTFWELMKWMVLVSISTNERNVSINLVWEAKNGTICSSSIKCVCLYISMEFSTVPQNRMKISFQIFQKHFCSTKIWSQILIPTNLLAMCTFWHTRKKNCDI